jgi:hypothetical protein
VVEITESSLFADIDLARSIVTSLKNQGIRWRSTISAPAFRRLSHLRSLPFDMIKIDRSFVTNIHRTGKRGDRPRRDHAGRALSVPVTASRASRTRRPMPRSLGSAARSARAGISASRCRPSRRASCSRSREAARSRRCQRRQRLSQTQALNFTRVPPGTGGAQFAHCAS